MSEPCGRCGVRADIGCKHRPAEGAPPASIRAAKPKARAQRFVGEGFSAFHKPRKRELERLVERAFKR
jgi:hypothetical protein